MAELSKFGSAIRATRSRVAKQSSAAESATRRPGSGRMLPRIFARASSSVIIAVGDAASVPFYLKGSYQLPLQDSIEVATDVGVGNRQFFVIFSPADVATRLWRVRARSAGPWLQVRWLSGRKQRFAKAPYLKRVPRVRIPPSPYLSYNTARPRDSHNNSHNGFFATCRF